MISPDMTASLTEIEEALPGFVATSENSCQGAKYHSPTPLVVHRFPIADEWVFLCATCADNFDVFAALNDRHSGKMPWALRRQFGNKIRAVAEKAYGAREASDGSGS